MSDFNVYVNFQVIADGPARGTRVLSARRTTGRAGPLQQPPDRGCECHVVNVAEMTVARVSPGVKQHVAGRTP